MRGASASQVIETITRDPRAWRPALEELDLEQYARFFGEKGFPRTAIAVGGSGRVRMGVGADVGAGSCGFAGSRV